MFRKTQGEPLKPDHAFAFCRASFLMTFAMSVAPSRKLLWFDLKILFICIIRWRLNQFPYCWDLQWESLKGKTTNNEIILFFSLYLVPQLFVSDNLTKKKADRSRLTAHKQLTVEPNESKVSLPWNCFRVAKPPTGPSTDNATGLPASSHPK